MTTDEELKAIALYQELAQCAREAGLIPLNPTKEIARLKYDIALLKVKEMKAYYLLPKDDE